MSESDDRLKTALTAVGDAYLRNNPADHAKVRRRIETRRRRLWFQAVAVAVSGAAATALMMVWWWGPEMTRLPEPIIGSLTDAKWQSAEGTLGGPGDQAMLRVAAGRRGFLAVGYDASEGDRDAAFWESSDGRVWGRVWHEEEIFGGPGDQIIYGIQRFRRGYVAAGSDSSRGDLDAAVWISPDGISWERVTATTFDRPGDQEIYRVSVDRDGLIALGADSSGADADAAMWLSGDGRSWWRKSGQGFAGPGGQVLRSAAVGPAGTVVVGRDSGTDGSDDAAVWVSDGVNWEHVVDPAAGFGGRGNQSLRAVASGPDGLVAAGEDSSGGDIDAAVWKSRDGRRWVRAEAGGLGGPGDQVVWAVDWTPAGWIAVGATTVNGDEDAAVWVSRDGSNWMLANDDTFRRPGFQRLLSVTAGGDHLVVIGYEGPRGNQDAVVWTSRIP